MSAAAARAPRAQCTVIIPARNAADTIAETLASVRAQTRADWHAVVVDDGSTDDTAAIVGRIAATDARVRLVPGPALGPGAARNVGLRDTTTPLACFLDADDLWAPSFLASMVAPLEARPDVAATYTGWRRLALDGSEELGPCPEVDGDLFALFAVACVIPPHACVLRADLLRAVNGFDERPTTTEDWDLWQRVARTGAWFVRVPGALVTYRMRVGSRSRDSRRVLDDGLAVIARGHAPDPRVAAPHPAHAAGLAADRRARHSFNHLSWAAGMAIASGDDAAPLLDAMQGQTAPDLDPWEVGGTLLEAIRVTLCASRPAGLALAVAHADGLLAFLAALERVALAPEFAVRATRALDALAIAQAPPGPARTSLITHAVVLDVGQPVGDLVGLPARVDRLRADLTYDGAVVGDLELPVCDGQVSGAVLADAIAEVAGWTLLHTFLAASVYPSLELIPAGGGVEVRRDGVVLGWSAAPLSAATMFEAAGWAAFLHESFGTGTPAPQMPEAPAVAVDVSDPPCDFHVAGPHLDVLCTVGGALLGVVPVPAVAGIVTAQRVREALAAASPNEFVRLVAREALVGRDVRDGVPLRVRLAIKRAHPDGRARRALPRGGLALLRHAGAPIGGPAARLSGLPMAARAVITRLALVTATPLMEVAPPADGDGGLAAAYLPDVPGTAAAPAVALVRRVPREPEPTTAATDDGGLLVLAYSRIAAQGPAGLAGARVDPERFAAQVAHVQARGYRGLARGEWSDMLDRGEPVPGRRVLFTFDGGYADFAAAWPVLERHGFGALVFLVTGAVGGRAQWDAPFGDEAPLLDWPVIRRLHEQGVSFGSNTVSNRWLTGCRPEAVVTELFESRAAIVANLGDPVTCLAYPHGAEDRAVRHLAGAAGYRLAMSWQGARWTNASHPLAVPRHVVAGTMTWADFVALCALG